MHRRRDRIPLSVAKRKRPVLSRFDESPANVGPMAPDLVAMLSERRKQPERELSWFEAPSFRRVRGPRYRPICACADRRAATIHAAVSAEYRIGRRHLAGGAAAARSAGIDRARRRRLWWRGGQFGRSIPQQHEPASQQKICCFSSARRLVAASDLVDRYYRRISACPLSRPSPAVAMVPVLPSALRHGRRSRRRCAPRLRRCARLELADAIVATKRSERGDAALNAQDRTHLRRAMINADHCMLLQPVEEPVRTLSISRN